MALFLVTPPTSEPITLADAKLQCRVDQAKDDELLTGLIVGVRMYIDGRDGWLGRALVTQVWDLRVDGFPGTGAPLELPLPPLQSVTSVSYVDADGDTVVWSSAEYTVRGANGSGKGTISANASWPGTAGTTGSVTVRYTAGYGTPLAVPAPIRQAALLLVEDLLDRPTDSTLRDRAYALLAPFRVSSF